MKAKKQLIGYVIKDWELKWGVEQAKMPSLWKTKDVYFDMDWNEGVKVKITIEEL